MAAQKLKEMATERLTKAQDMIKQMMGNVNPQQMQNVIQQAKQMGCPDNILNQIQNFK